ncbi:MAG: FRG domain-containing protein [Nitrospirota bacterium]|nr:FRG domain-containing protein [Nitrospirota bacterium]
MNIIDLAWWEDFEKTVSSIFAEWQMLKDEKRYEPWVTPRFRGHSDADWKLETSLERFTKKSELEAESYDKMIRAVRPAVISITGKSWDLPECENHPVPEDYEFMTYLRHHGFPSPLLDWTRSPYVAAFFAFRSEEKRKDKKVAIYSYVENFVPPEGFNSQAPTIHGLGPYIVTHKRHYAQQCEYTICKKRTDDRYVYSSHETAFQGTKYTLPVSDREKVLKQLHRMNVTAFSLFGNEETLMETLAYQEIETNRLMSGPEECQFGSLL